MVIDSTGKIVGGKSDIDAKLSSGFVALENHTKKELLETVERLNTVINKRNIRIQELETRIEWLKTERAKEDATFRRMLEGKKDLVNRLSDTALAVSDRENKIAKLGGEVQKYRNAGLIHLKQLNDSKDENSGLAVENEIQEMQMDLILKNHLELMKKHYRMECDYKILTGEHEELIRDCEI